MYDSNVTLPWQIFYSYNELKLWALAVSATPTLVDVETQHQWREQNTLFLNLSALHPAGIPLAMTGDCISMSQSCNMVVFFTESITPSPSLGIMSSWYFAIASSNALRLMASMCVATSAI
jgi:hypothetical protein